METTTFKDTAQAQQIFFQQPSVSRQKYEMRYLTGGPWQSREAKCKIKSETFVVIKFYFPCLSRQCSDGSIIDIVGSEIM